MTEELLLQEPALHDILVLSNDFLLPRAPKNSEDFFAQSFVKEGEMMEEEDENYALYKHFSKRISAMNLRDIVNSINTTNTDKDISIETEPEIVFTEFVRLLKIVFLQMAYNSSHLQTLDELSAFLSENITTIKSRTIEIFNKLGKKGKGRKLCSNDLFLEILSAAFAMHIRTQEDSEKISDILDAAIDTAP